MGITFASKDLNKLQRNMQEMQLSVKYDDIKANVSGLVNSSTLHHHGIVNTIINNVLKENR
jgi:hypothetical protein